jgi:glyoxylase-like metal-dependent hydrolase (beta-lactamase superfamily II)
MKRTHRPDLWCWSRFDPARDLDFNGWLWVTRFGNVAVDPLPLTDDDRAKIGRLGGVGTVVVTNSDHTRGARAIAEEFGAELVGPRAEQAGFPLPCHRWVGDGESVVGGLIALEMNGSKTPGELALVLEGTTLITGDLVRGPVGGKLALLPRDKLKDEHAALASVRALEERGCDAVLVGDGWPVFSGGKAALGAAIRSHGAR